MAKSSFARKAQTESAPAAEQNAAAAPAENTEKALATRPQRSLGPVQHTGKDDMFGEWLPGDSKLPRLNIVQKSSSSEDLLSNFELGDLVFARKIKLANEKTPVTMVAVLGGKDYQQKVKFGEGQGVVYRTSQEVLDNGGTLNWSKEAVDDQIYFQPRAHIQLAVKAPEGLTDEDLNYFPFTYTDGSRWAMAIFTVVSSSYTSFAKELETLRRHNLTMMNGLVSGNLSVTTLKKSKPGQEWFVPVPKLVGANDKELVAFLESIT
jgi:hypothetical protein